MPFDIPYGMSIGLERAKQVMAAAEAEAKKRNWKMNIAVVDTNGELVHFSRMEGAQIASGLDFGRQGPHRGALPPRDPGCSTTPMKPAIPIPARSIRPWSRAPAGFRWSKAAS